MFDSLDVLLLKPIEGGSVASTTNASKLKIAASNSYIAYKRKLMEIIFRDCYYTIANMNNYSGIFELTEFKESFEKCDNAMHLLNTNQEQAENANLAKNVFDSIINLNNAYDSLKHKIQAIKLVGNELGLISSEDTVQIRLLSEENGIDTLIVNLKLIQSIYDNINKALNVTGEPLRYSRLESGSLEVILAGSIATFAAFKPMIEFGYKVYSEQFSKKARLEATEKEIKVRGEYLKFLKDAGCELDSETTQKILFDLDTGIKELFSKNPYIELQNKQIGLSELKDKAVPIKLIDSHDILE